MPAALTATITGWDNARPALIRAWCAEAATRRVLVTGNGASMHAAYALALGALDEPRLAVQLVPAGLLLSGAVHLQPEDSLVVVSTSGQLRDLIHVAEARPHGCRMLTVTADPHSPLARAADVVVPIHVITQEAVTHTQAYAAATLTCTWLLNMLRLAVAGTTTLRAANGLAASALETAEVVAEGLETAGEAIARWLAMDQLRACHFAVVFASGAAWPAALQGALLVKELAGIASEGAETREAATSAYTGINPGSLFVGLGGDDLVDDALRSAAEAGATTVQLAIPQATAAQVQLAAFPAALAFALALASHHGLDPDRPWWYDGYLRTARLPGRQTTSTS